MLIIIIVLLLIIIFILCPAILGNLLAGVAIVVGNLVKAAIPLSICVVFYLLLFFFDRIAKKSNRLSDKAMKYIGIGKAAISFIIGMALAITMNYAGLYFPSYVILFTSLIYPAVLYAKAAKLNGESKFMGIVWLAVLSFVALVFMYEFSFLAELDLFGLHSGENFQIGDCLREREMPSEITALITLIGFPALLCFLFYGAIKDAIKEKNKEKRIPLLPVFASILMGLICGYASYECYPYISVYFF